MPVINTVRSESVESDGTAYTERRYGCYGWGLITSLLLLTFIMIVSVILLVQSDDAVLLLSVLLVLMIIVALLAFGFLHWQRRQAIRRRDQGASEWVHRTHSQDQMNATTPSGSHMSARSSWVHWAPWKTSASRGNNTPSAPPSYHVVST